MPNSFYELMLNNETIPSAAVRRAIDLALDKEALCLHTAQGLGGNGLRSDPGDGV